MSTVDTTAVTGIGQEIYSANLQAELVVAGCTWSRFTAELFGEDAIVAGVVAADEFTATQDGKDVAGCWQQVEGCGEEVYYERYSGGVCQSHGWVDVKSRQIVQVG